MARAPCVPNKKSHYLGGNTCRAYFGSEQADLVLLDASPLDDIRNTRKIFAVIMGGRYYSRLDLDRMLAKAAEAAERQK